MMQNAPLGRLDGIYKRWSDEQGVAYMMLSVCCKDWVEYVDIGYFCIQCGNICKTEIGLLTALEHATHEQSEEPCY